MLVEKNMNIKTHFSIFFQDLAQGIVLDNAYDLYLRNRYIDYVDENKINYIFSQDVDMNLVSFFPNVEFLTIPEEAQNLQALYSLRKIRGMEISARCLEILDLSKFENLEYLLIRGQPENVAQLENCKKLRILKCLQWKMSDLTKLKSIKTLRGLEIEFCDSLQSLNGIGNLTILEKVSIIYCSKLRQIEELKGVKDSLKRLILEDCNKIEDLSTIALLCNLEFLLLSSFQTRGVNKLPSLKFIREMPHLKEFLTDYKIEDGDLTPLLKVDKVDVLKFYQHYNLKENAFSK